MIFYKKETEKKDLAVNFGYIEGSKNEDTAALMTESVLTKAIKRFQVSHTFQIDQRD